MDVYFRYPNGDVNPAPRLMIEAKLPVKGLMTKKKILGWRGQGSLRGPRR